MYLKSFLVKFLFIPLALILFVMLPDILFSLFNKHYLFEINFTEMKKLFIFILLLSFLSLRMKVTILSIFYLLIFFTLASFNYFGTLITPYDILLFFTNFSEVIDALKDIQSLFLLPLIVTIFSFIVLVLFLKQIDKYCFHFHYAKILFFLMLFVLPIRIYTDVYIKKIDSVMKYPQTTSTSLRNTYKAINYFLVVTLPKKLQNPIKSVVTEKDTKFTISSHPQHNIILIIGESFRAKDAEILYPKLLQTMPELTKMKQQNYIAVKKCIASGVMTKVSISYFLHQVDKLNHISRVHNPNFALFKLAQENNFHTYFQTHQSANDSRYLIPMISAQNIETLLTPKNFSLNNTIDSVTDDMQLNEEVKKLNLSKPTFAVFQMQGSHMPYSTKSPQKYKKFNSEYQNSIFYTDAVLAKVIKYLASTRTKRLPTYLFFVSDHGEMLGEKGMHGHGHLEKEVYEVPFFYFATKRNEQIDKFLDTHNILTQYDISQMIKLLLGYKTSLHTKKQRKILVMGKDIDGYNGYKELYYNPKNF